MSSGSGEDINIHLDEGEIVSLIGVSGSGKTTLFNILSGIALPDSGQAPAVAGTSEMQ